MANFLKECFESVDTELDGEANPEEFKEVFCSRCMNDECELSGWSYSQWKERMNRQEEATFNPQYGEPSQFESQANQAFKTLGENDAERIQTSQWSSWSEEAEIHQSDPDTKNKEAGKVDKSLKALESSDEGDSESHEEESEPEQNKNRDVKKEDLNSDPENDTLPDQSGKILDGGDPTKGESERVQESNKWDVKKESKGNVTVNISSGERENE